MSKQQRNVKKRARKDDVRAEARTKLIETVFEGNLALLDYLLQQVPNKVLKSIAKIEVIK